MEIKNHRLFADISNQIRGEYPQRFHHKYISAVENIILKMENKTCRNNHAAYNICLRKQIIANGDFQIGLYCTICKEWAFDKAADWIPHKPLELYLMYEGESIDDIPFKDDAIFIPQQCDHCGDVGGVETHHIMPRHIFDSHRDLFTADDNIDKWGTITLCRKCHALWHSTVTPDMCRGF
jgi:hypothetical protein